MPFCTACGKQNPDEARFCSQCGTRLVNDDAEASAAGSSDAAVAASEIGAIR